MLNIQSSRTCHNVYITMEYIMPSDNIRCRVFWWQVWKVVKIIKRYIFWDFTKWIVTLGAFDSHLYHLNMFLTSKESDFSGFIRREDFNKRNKWSKKVWIQTEIQLTIWTYHLAKQDTTGRHLSYVTARRFERKC